MRMPLLLARQPTRRLGATRWRPAAHLRCSSPPFSTPQCLLSTSAAHRTSQPPLERQYQAPPPREPPVPSPACSPPSIRPAVHARNNELLERLVECIPRAPVCIPVSSLYLLFTIDGATTPVLFESAWNFINSASETTSTAVAAPKSSAKEKRAGQLACARPSPIDATAFSALS
ncbi:hypothetical protein CGC20_38475 [Leishmania donovani]|uniref:Uncharacterized protein n=1 Tax=Leishmania donovani TaxID=5661 RepID=A0A504XY22_LEIDO|nr:hypothetical protein CGC20_38475 [Leishmania donovani]